MIYIFHVRDVAYKFTPVQVLNPTPPFQKNRDSPLKLIVKISTFTKGTEFFPQT